MTITLDAKKNLTAHDIERVSSGTSSVTLSAATRKLLTQRRADIEHFITTSKRPAYGFNRGFGHNVDLSVSEEQLAHLQHNLILSHAVGVGDPAEPAIVRTTMLLRANSLARGYSGVRPQLIDQLLAFLNHNITPMVPEYGSVGASGDLAPLSHIGMALIGKGRVLYLGEKMEATEAMQRAGLRPLTLEMKEGLALNNGVQFMNGMGLHACSQLKNILKSAAINSALVSQVMLAPDSYFRRDFHAVRPHPGAQQVADWIWQLMQNSPIRQAHRDVDVDGQIQDPYNIRCAAQVLGSCYELIDQAEKTFLIEANSATDNPIILAAEKKGHSSSSAPHTDIISGGHFHGMPVAVQIYNLLQSQGIIASLAHQRSARFVDQSKNKGLPRDLKWPVHNDERLSLTSGMMMLEYTSAALTNDIWGSLMPSHIFNIGTNSSHEDHVSMGTSLAVRLLNTLPKVVHVLAIELAYTCQAIALRKHLPTIPSHAPLSAELADRARQITAMFAESSERVHIAAAIHHVHPLSPQQRNLSPVSEKIYRHILDNQLFSLVKHDRSLAEDIAALAAFIGAGDLVELTQSEIPLPWP